MGRALLALAVALSSLLAATAPAGASRAHVDSPNTARQVSASSPSYYLALGDSLARGYQPVSPYYGHGYADDLLNLLQSQQPGLQLVNLGCVDETTATFLGQNGTHCKFWQYTTGMTTTPQITQALTFLQDHPGQVSLITIDIGVNDLLGSTPQHPALARATSGMNRISTNLDQILTQVQTAAANAGDQNVRILIMTYYDPYVGSSFSLITTLITLMLDNMISSVATKHNVSVARVYRAFNETSNSKQTICKLTWYCSLLHHGDPHPNAAGYQVIAQQFMAAGAGNQ